MRPCTSGHVAPALRLLCALPSVAEGTRGRAKGSGVRIRSGQMASGTPHDMMWDEDRPSPGPRDRNNYLSFPEDGEFYLATDRALPWEACGPHDTNRVVVPGVFVENLFRLAPVPDPSQFKTLMFIDFCLHTVTFM